MSKLPRLFERRLPIILLALKLFQPLVTGERKFGDDKKAESEFFVDNSALAGFTGERILYMAVRELIENALDSCEINHILPRISLSLKLLDQANDLWLISCEDNGIGIPSDKVPVAVCSFLTSAKYVEKQQRGLFGVGLKDDCCFFLRRIQTILFALGRSQEKRAQNIILNSELISAQINQ